MSAPRCRARIAAVASYLPEGRLTNEMLCHGFEDWTPEKISDKTGIHSRARAASDEFTSDLAVKAAERLFERTGRDREQIDMLMLMTVSPDYVIPFTAGMVQHRLGLPQTTGAFDATLGCSGYVYGLGMAASFLESGRARNVLLLTADRFSPYTDDCGIGERSIFGDGATATLIEGVDEGVAQEAGCGGLVGATRYGTDGSGAHNLLAANSSMKAFAAAEGGTLTRPRLEMNGPEVFKFTLTSVVRHVKSFLKDNDLAIDSVDLFIFHQANGFMLEHLRQKLRVPEERFALDLGETGNILSSTIPYCLDRALQAGRVGPGSRVVLVGFGVGYSWGSVLVDFPA